MSDEGQLWWQLMGHLQDYRVGLREPEGTEQQFEYHIAWAGVHILLEQEK